MHAQERCFGDVGARGIIRCQRLVWIGSAGLCAVWFVSDRRLRRGRRGFRDNQVERQCDVRLRNPENRATGDAAPGERMHMGAEETPDKWVFDELAL